MKVKVPTKTLHILNAEVVVMTVKGLCKFVEFLKGCRIPENNMACQWHVILCPQI